MSESEQISPEMGDKRKLLERLKESMVSYLAATDVPESAARVSPGEGCWSILQITEHLTIVEYGLMKRLGEADANPNPPDRGRDSLIEEGAVNRGNPRSAPEPSHPANRFQSLADARAELRRRRQESIALIESRREDLRAKWVKHPFSEMDGHQLVLLMCSHLHRHIAQVNEIKNLAAYRAACEQKAVS